MKKLRMTVELEYDDSIMHGDDQESYDWFINEVLCNPKENEQLILHSNCIGDDVGEIKVISCEQIF